MIIVNAETPDEAAAAGALLARQDVLAYRILVAGAEQPPHDEFDRITSRLPDPEKPAAPEPAPDSRRAALRGVLRDADGPLSLRAVCMLLDLRGMSVARETAHRWLQADLAAGLIRRAYLPEGGPLWRYERVREEPPDPRHEAMRVVLRGASRALALHEIGERLATLGVPAPREKLNRWLVLDRRAGLVREADTRPGRIWTYEWAGEKP